MTFRRSIATVIGPTPPGTGEIQPATPRTASKSTSPTVIFVPSGPAIRLMPTSITTAPGFTQSAPTRRGTPQAAMITSHSRASRGSSGVNLLVECTVASSRIRRTAIGLPTMLLAPTTTQRLPRSSMPVCSIISSAASAVHGTRLRRP